MHLHLSKGIIHQTLFRFKARRTDQSFYFLFGEPETDSGRGNHVFFNHGATEIIGAEKSANWAICGPWVTQEAWILAKLSR